MLRGRSMRDGKGDEMRSKIHRWVTWPLAAWVSFLALAVLTLYQMGQG